jgi:hypothetical protein
LLPFAGLPAGTNIFIEVDKDDYSLLHIKYMLSEDFHLLDDEDFWFESSAGVHEKEYRI